MNMIHEATIEYVAIDENGNDRKVKENYIVDSLGCFTEVEEKLVEDFMSLTAMDVTAIKRSKVKEIANSRASDDEKIFLATLVDVFLNDDGNEKEIKYTIAFYSKDMNTAHAYIREYASQGYNMSITKIVESKFSDVLK